MESIANMFKDLKDFTSEHGVFQTCILLVIIGYIIRDWWIRKQNTGIFDALVNNNKIMTGLFEKQVSISERASQASAISAVELSKQTSKLDMICESQKTMIQLTTAGNTAIDKLADSFGSDPLKLCKANPCEVKDEWIVAKFSSEWKMPSEKVREWIEKIRNRGNNPTDPIGIG